MTFRRALMVLGAVIVLGYVAIVALLAFNETRQVFVSAGEGRRGRQLPADDAGIPWDTLRVRAADSVSVFLLRSPVDTMPATPWAIFFHGNAGMIGSRDNVARYRLLRDAGFNVLAVEYRGYGMSSGHPVSEDGIHADARAALRYLADSLRVPTQRVIAYGWSLGSGPAARLASEHELGAVVTEGGFTSLPDVGAAIYPWIPVRLVMRNRFDNAALASRVAEPWIILHGRHDTEISFSHGERLASLAPLGQLVPLDAGHDDGVIADRGTALATLENLRSRIIAWASP